MGWSQLADIARETAAALGEEDPVTGLPGGGRRPARCPNDGAELAESGGDWRCPFDGWTWSTRAVPS